MLVYNHNHGCLSNKEIPSLTLFKVQKAVTIGYSSLTPFIQPDTAKAASTLFIFSENGNRIVSMFIISHSLYRLKHRIKIYILIEFHTKNAQMLRKIEDIAHERAEALLNTKKKDLSGNVCHHILKLVIEKACLHRMSEQTQIQYHCFLHGC